MARLYVTAAYALTLAALFFPGGAHADQVDPWKMVFRQTAPFAFSSQNNWAQAQSLNSTDPTSDNFSILNQLESYRSADGKLTFKLVYPQDFPGMRQVWQQTSNPVLARKNIVTGYHAVDIAWTGMDWYGLEKSGSSHNFLDGQNRQIRYNYVIGQVTTPMGYEAGQLAGPGAPVSRVELYVCEPHLVDVCAPPTPTAEVTTTTTVAPTTTTAAPAATNPTIQSCHVATVESCRGWVCSASQEMHWCPPGILGATIAGSGGGYCCVQGAWVHGVCPCTDANSASGSSSASSSESELSSRSAELAAPISTSVEPTTAPSTAAPVSTNAPTPVVDPSNTGSMMDLPRTTTGDSTATPEVTVPTTSANGPRENGAPTVDATSTAATSVPQVATETPSRVPIPQTTSAHHASSHVEVSSASDESDPQILGLQGVKVRSTDEDRCIWYDWSTWTTWCWIVFVVCMIGLYCVLHGIGYLIAKRYLGKHYRTQASADGHVQPDIAVKEQQVEESAAAAVSYGEDDSSDDGQETAEVSGDKTTAVVIENPLGCDFHSTPDDDGLSEEMYSNASLSSCPFETVVETIQPCTEEAIATDDEEGQNSSDTQDQYHEV